VLLWLLGRRRALGTTTSCFGNCWSHSIKVTCKVRQVGPSCWVLSLHFFFVSIIFWNLNTTNSWCSYPFYKTEKSIWRFFSELRQSM
jgi:hypothetical protein